MPAEDGPSANSGAMRRTLAFIDSTNEALFAAESLKESGATARRFFTCLLAIYGLYIVVVIALAQRPLIIQVLYVIVFVLAASAWLFITKTTTGQRNQPQLISAVGLVIFSILSVTCSFILIKNAPGQLLGREPDFRPIPECTTIAVGVTLHPSTVNFTSSAAYKDPIWSSFTAQTCHYTTTDGEVRVIEMKNWAAKHYDLTAHDFYRVLFVAMWAIWGLGVVLLFSMRFVHAVTTVGLPGFVLWCATCASSSHDPSSVATYTLILFFPAFLVIFGMPWQLERFKRALFLERQKNKRLMKEKDQTIKRGKTKMRKMEQQLNDARKTVERVMAAESAALRSFELPYADIDWGTSGGGKRKKLGEGSFGTVYKATLRGEHDVAVKTMRVSKISEREIIKFKSELIVMSPLHHPNLVKLWGGVWNEGADKLCIVLEFCSLGSLRTFLLEDAGTWKGLRHGLALGAAKGLRYLHHELNKPLIHRDIKPENIMVSADPVITAKLGDFGESRNFDLRLAKERKEDQGKLGDDEGAGGVKSDALSMTIVGTKRWCAPEIMTGQPYNESIDTFSFGLVLLCLAVGDIDRLRSEGRLITEITYVSGWRPSIRALEECGCPDLPRMWVGDFRLRPALSDVVSRLEACAEDLRLKCEEEVPVVSNLRQDSGEDIIQEEGANDGAGASSAGADSNKRATISVSRGNRMSRIENLIFKWRSHKL